MDSILRKYGSLPIERKEEISKIENSISLSPDIIVQLGVKSLTSLKENLEVAAKNIDLDLNQVSTTDAMQVNQDIIDNLTKISYELENCVFAIEFFLRGKKTKDVFINYHKLSLSEKIQFRNTQMLMDMLEEKSMSLLQASILAMQCKMQFVINNDLLSNTNRE